mgnify:CR=1 FL=1
MHSNSIVFIKNFRVAERSTKIAKAFCYLSRHRSILKKFRDPTSRSALMPIPYTFPSLFNQNLECSSYPNQCSLPRSYLCVQSLSSALPSPVPTKQQLQQVFLWQQVLSFLSVALQRFHIRHSRGSQVRSSLLFTISEQRRTPTWYNFDLRQSTPSIELLVARRADSSATLIMQYNLTGK